MTRRRLVRTKFQSWEGEAPAEPSSQTPRLSRSFALPSAGIEIGSIRIFFAAMLVAMLAGGPARAEMRTWTDKSGKFSVEAEFVEILDGKLRLKLADGKTVALPLAKISEKDRVFVRDLLKQKRDAAAAAANADATGPGGRFPGLRGRFGNERSAWAVGDRVQREFGSEVSVGTIVGIDGTYVKVHFDGTPDDEIDSLPASWVEPLTERAQQIASWSWTPPAMKPSIPANYAGVGRPAFNPTAPSKLTPDPMPVPASASQPPGPARFGGKFGFFERFITVDVATGAAPVAVAAYQGGKEIRDIGTRLEVVDVATASLRGNFSGPAKLKMVHLSPSGKRLATRCEPAETWGTEFIDVWELGEKGLVHVATWAPYANAPERDREISSVTWVDDGRLLTTGGSGQVVLWQIEGAKALYELGRAGGSFALSPGSKQLATASAKGIDVYSVESGAHLAHLPTTVGAGSVAFSPSGRRLVVSGSLGAEVIDALGEEPTLQFYFGGAGSLSWLDEQFLIGGDGLVIDAVKQAAVWRYRRNGTGWSKFGRFWYLTDGREGGTLLSVALPHDAAKAAAVGLNTQDVFAVAPGMAVTLDVELGDATANAEGLAKLTAAVQAAGLRVEAGQPITLTARTRGGDNKDMTYRRMFGGGRQEETISVPTRYYDVEMLVGGERVWNTSGYQGPPGMMQMKENESIQEGIAKEMGVKASYLPSVVPMRIVKAEYQKPRGESQLTERGIEDLPAGAIDGAVAVP